MCRLLQGYGYPVQPGEAVSYGSTPDLTGLDGVHIECKRGERQALAPWLVCMTLENWIELYQRKKAEEIGKERSE